MTALVSAVGETSLALYSESFDECSSTQAGSETTNGTKHDIRERRMGSIAIPGISVIIPTYNRAQLVTKAIESVLAQTYHDYEIIVVDDGSTDNTREVLEPYMNRIKYLYQENLGPSAARNAGIRASRGEWIAFLDSDDRWLPEKLTQQIEYLQQTGLQICFTNSYYDFGDETKNKNKNLDTQTATNKWIITEPLEIITSSDFFHTTLSSMVIHRTLLDSTYTFNERLSRGEDRCLILKVCAERPIAYINRRFVIFDRTTDKERLTKYLPHEVKKARDNAYVLSYAEVYFRCRKQSKKNIKTARRMLGFYLSVLAVSCCLEGDNYNARRFAKDSLYFGGGWRTYRRCIAVLICPWLVRRLRKNDGY
jgi:glycosyltransferase involved in cell wall biosynthesis